MASIAQSLPASNRSLAWLWEWLRDELAPYPGRALLVARMVIAATLVMIIGMTFRIPYAWQGAIYALLVSRESPRATLKSRGNDIPRYWDRRGLHYPLDEVGDQYSPASFPLDHCHFVLCVLCDQHADKLPGGGCLCEYNLRLEFRCGTGMCPPRPMWRIRFGCVWQY